MHTLHSSRGLFRLSFHLGRAGRWPRSRIGPIAMAADNLRRSGRLRASSQQASASVSASSEGAQGCKNSQHSCSVPRKVTSKRRGGAAASLGQSEQVQKRPARKSGAVAAGGTDPSPADRDTVPARSEEGADVLFRVQDDVVRGTLLRRPSERNKAPWVADLQLPCGRTAIVHVPSLNMGGKCDPGAVMIAKPARDTKGRLVGPNAASKQYGTPKCEFICQLVENLEPENQPGGCLIGAHPRLGEMAGQALLKEGTVFPPLSSSQITRVRREVKNVANCDMRADMVVEFADGTAAVVEVKTVVDTDYSPETAPALSAAERRKRCVFIGEGDPYRRAAIFPWGRQTQKLDPNDRSSPKVVSTRAIKHVRELTAIASGEKKSTEYDKLSAAVLFVVARSDAQLFRVNHEACPEFAKQAVLARDSGVKIVASHVEFCVDPSGGGFVALDRGLLSVDWSFETAQVS